MIFILTGPVHSGKTSLLKTLVANLNRYRVSVRGFLSLAAYEEGRHIGYDLFDLEKQSVSKFIRKSGHRDWQKIGEFYFIPEVLKHAQKIIDECRPPSWLIVDEVGPLELQGQGLWPSLSAALERDRLITLLVVRESLLYRVRKSLGGKEIHIFSCPENEAPASLADRLVQKSGKQEGR